MPTPTPRRRRCASPVSAAARRPTQKQLRDAASQLAEEGQLLWLVGQGLHFALAAGEVPAHGDGFVEALRAWASRAIRATVSLRHEVPLAPRSSGDRPTPSTTLDSAGGTRPSQCDGNDGAAEAGVPVVWISSQTVRGSWVSLAVGVDRQGHKKALSLQEGSTSDPVVARKVLQEVAAHVDPLAGVLVITDGSRTLDDAAEGQWEGAVQIGHCHLSLRHDLLAHVPKDERAELGDALELAWRQPPGEAAKSLKSLVSSLRRRHPGAAERLERSLEACLQVAGLGVRAPLREHLESTGVVRMAIEKALRWGKSAAGGPAAVAAGLPIWQQRTKRLIGYRALPALAATLQDKGTSTS